MKKFFIVMIVIWASVSFSCSKSETSSEENTTSAGTYTVKAIIEGGGTLQGATIYTDTELQEESKSYSVFTDNHVASMIGKTEWEGSYDIKKSIKVQVNARETTEKSVLTVYLLKDGKEIKKDEQKGIGTVDGMVASVNIIL